jgi:hypothetical protein
MSEQDTSGTPAAAPRESHPAPGFSATPGSADSPAPTGTFGGTRGSGLARGKRPTQSAASPAAPAVNTGYKPSSIEIITPQREYKNPFAAEEPAASAAPEAPITPAPTAVTPPPAPVPAATLPVQEPAPAAQPATTEHFPYTPREKTPAASEPLSKSELNILPPAEAKRTPQSWESSTQPAEKPAHESRPRRDDRPTFRPDRRESREHQPRDPRDQPRDPRDHQPRDPRDARPEQREPRRDDRRPAVPAAAAHAPAKKSGGFIGWLKSLFGGSSSPSPSTGASGGRSGDDNRGDGDFRQHRRRHRGGRGRGGFQGDNRGPRQGGQFQPREGGAQPSAGGEGHGDQAQGDGFRRRRRRGGRGRNRNGNRDHGGGDPRPEGTQGGGAI